MIGQIICGDVLAILRDRFKHESVQCCVTSPPYWGLRDYGVAGQLGLENTPEEYVAKMVEVFREVRRVLKADGTLWLNLGDTYTTNIGGNRNGHDNTTWDHAESESLRSNSIGTTRLRANAKEYGLKPKDLVGIPWRVAFALQSDGWYLRSDIIWAKPNPMPESVTDRPTKSHEYLFLLSKSEKYYYDAAAIAEPLQRPEEGERKTPARFGGADKWVEAQKQSRLHSGNEYLGTENGTRNKRSVWTVATQPYADAHFATFPPKLIEPCILAGAQAGSLVLDPFAGSGTTIMVAQQLGRHGVGIELNQDYIMMAERRIAQQGLAL